MSISMYFAVSWIEPRLKINESAPEWSEDRTGPKDVSFFLPKKKGGIRRQGKLSSLLVGGGGESLFNYLPR